MVGNPPFAWGREAEPGDDTAPVAPWRAGEPPLAGWPRRTSAATAPRIPGFRLPSIACHSGYAVGGSIKRAAALPAASNAGILGGNSSLDA